MSILTEKAFPLFLYSEVFEFLEKKVSNSPGKKALFCDETIYSFYQRPLETLRKENASFFLYVFPTGEKYKNRNTKENLEDFLFLHSFQKEDMLFALGGGVTLDLVGFLASTYLRGIAFISIPTTFLAMVDACFGGKTGINTAFGKNLIGSFYPPLEIWIDPLFLETLCEDAIKEGLSEVVKKGLIQDASLLDEIDLLRENLLRKEKKALLSLVKKSLFLKKELIEKGVRDLLNLGHTVAHGLEAFFSYQIPHGRAVAWGLLIETFFSYKQGFLSEEEQKKIACFLQRLGLLSPLAPIQIESLIKTLHLDKKNQGESIGFIALEKRGKALFPAYFLPSEKVREYLFLFQKESYANFSLTR